MRLCIAFLIIGLALVAAEFTTGSSVIESCTTNGELGDDAIACESRLAISFSLGNQDATGRYEISSAKNSEGTEISFEPIVLQCTKQATGINYLFTKVQDRAAYSDVVESAFEGTVLTKFDAEAHSCIDNQYESCNAGTKRSGVPLSPDTLAYRKFFCLTHRHGTGQSLVFKVPEPILRWRMDCSVTLPWAPGDELPDIQDAAGGTDRWITDEALLTATTTLVFSDASPRAALGAVATGKIVGELRPGSIPLSERVGDYALVPMTSTGPDDPYVDAPLDNVVVVSANEYSGTGSDCGRVGTTTTGYMAGDFCSGQPGWCLPVSPYNLIREDELAMAGGAQPTFLWRHMAGVGVPYAANAAADAGQLQLDTTFTPALSHSLQVGFQVDGAALRITHVICGGNITSVVLSGMADITTHSAVAMAVTLEAACVDGQAASFVAEIVPGECLTAANGVASEELSLTAGQPTTTTFRLAATCAVTDGTVRESSVTLRLRRQTDLVIIDEETIEVMINSDYANGENALGPGDGDDNPEAAKGSCPLGDMACCFVNGGGGIIEHFVLGCSLSASILAVIYAALLSVAVAVFKRMVWKIVDGKRKKQEFRSKPDPNAEELSIKALLQSGSALLQSTPAPATPTGSACSPLPPLSLAASAAPVPSPGGGLFTLRSSGRTQPATLPPPALDGGVVLPALEPLASSSVDEETPSLHCEPAGDLAFSPDELDALSTGAALPAFLHLTTGEHSVAVRGELRRALLLSGPRQWLFSVPMRHQRNAANELLPAPLRASRILSEDDISTLALTSMRRPQFLLIN